MNTKEKIYDDIPKIIKNVAENLFCMPKEVKKTVGDENNCQRQPPPIIFPSKRDDEVRISEQELRMLFCKELFKRGYYFSIETPTKNRYKFGKKVEEIKLFGKNEKGGQSASIDTTVFVENGENRLERILNVEFKHSGGLHEISKDILKLFSEKENGLFVYLLKNSDDGTFTNENGKCLFKKFVNAIKAHKKSWKEENGSKKFIMFFFIILEEGIFFFKKKKFEKSDLNNIKNFFYEKLQKKAVNELADDGWEIKRIKGQA